MSADFLLRVKADLATLRAADPGFDVFGSAAHRYELLAPARDDHLAAFEAAHGIALPSAYRRFLRELGNGGAGPHYGLFPLGLWDGGGQGLEPWGEYGAGVLREPFPHSTPWNLPDDRFMPPDLDDVDAEEAWQTALDAEYFDRSLVAGAFPIAHHGCAHRNLLVVTGPHRGEVWLDARASHEGIAPEVDAQGRRRTFETWYLDWLRASLATVSG